MIEWLFSYIDPARVHEVDFFVSWHGRFMAMAWGFLVPIGIIAARFFKVTPHQNWPEKLDNKAWWSVHRYANYGAVTFTVIGVVLIFYKATEVVGESYHARLGWLVIALTLSQIVSAILRGSKGGPTKPAPDGSLRGDHYDMSTHRLRFEYYHKTMGYALLLLASYTIVSGMWVANAPIWMWLTLGIWWVVLLGSFAVLQRLGGCFDTYRAIWGSNPALPGNKRKPVGIGVSTDKPWRHLPTLPEKEQPSLDHSKVKHFTSKS